MNRTIWTRSCILLLCGLVLTAGWAEKVRKTPKTDQEIANYRRNHPDAAQAQPARPTPPRPTTVAPVPYTRPGASNPNGQSHVPPYAVSLPQPGQPFARPGQTWTGNPQRPNPGTPEAHPNQPHNGQDGHGNGDDHNAGYPPHRPGQPDRPNQNGHENQCGRDDDDHEHHGNCGGGRSTPIFIYQSPVCFPVPRYVPVPEYIPVPQYIPAPRPRYGDGYAYYPQSAGQWNAPDCGDITRFPLLGCEIIAADGTFLGVIDRAYGSPESIANRNSAYGSPYSQLSIWNPEGPYGSPDGPYSPWNRNSYRPPVLYWHGEFRGYLSINPDLQPKVSPASLPEHIKTSPWR